jgi:ATP-dependent DNA ligase
MLAKLTAELPAGDEWRYEPKWDGFRCLVFVDAGTGEVDIRSRQDKSMSRYFPEVVDAIGELLPSRSFVLDGELVVRGARPFDFAALMKRLHPASKRVDRLREETPAELIAFDLLAVDDRALLDEPFNVRRRELERLLDGRTAPERLRLTPSTSERSDAERWLAAPTPPGIDGVVAKSAQSAYQPGKRVMVKVKRHKTADCVVAGFRLLAGDEPLVSSLLLGLYDDDGTTLRHVGVVGSFTKARRRELLAQLVPMRVPLEGHPWEHGFGLERSPLGRLRGSAGRWTPDMGLDWIPVRASLVAEVAYDQVDFHRFRHPARFVRWRSDRDAKSCRLDQLDD